MHKAFYNLNNVVKFSLAGPKKFVHSFRYKNYITNCLKSDELDFEIYLGDYTPDLQNCQILDDEYFVKYNYLFCKDSYKLLNWALEIKNFETEGAANINISLFPKFMRNSSVSYALVEGFIIDAIIHYYFSCKKCALLHASCVSENGVCKVFVARSGAGKTSILLHLIKDRFKFVSDNFTILSPNNKASGFVEPLNIFNYNLNDDLYVKMTKSKKIELKMSYLLYKLSNGYFKIFTRVDPCEIFDCNKESIDINSLYLILPKTNVEIPRMEPISKKELMEHIYFNQYLELPFFNKYISAYIYAFPHSNLSNHWNNYKKNITENLDEVTPCYKMEVPKSYNLDAFNRILELIKS